MMSQYFPNNPRIFKTGNVLTANKKNIAIKMNNIHVNAKLKQQPKT